MDRREECRILIECWREKKKNGEEAERVILSEKQVYQWRSGKIKRKRTMRAEWKGQKHRQARKKGKKQKIQIQQGRMRGVDRETSGVLRKREYERKKNDGEILMREREERKQLLDGKRGKKVQNVLWGEVERDNWAHVEWM
jgi:hypothetical protein